MTSSQPSTEDVYKEYHGTHILAMPGRVISELFLCVRTFPDLISPAFLIASQ